MSSLTTFVLLVIVSVVVCSWTDPSPTKDGSNVIDSVVQAIDIDILEFNTHLTEDDVVDLDFCDASADGSVPCRNKPNFFKSLEYDYTSGNFWSITDRGPVYNCQNFPAAATNESVIGRSDSDAVYVSNYAPTLVSFSVDADQVSGFQYSMLTDKEASEPLSGLAKSDENNFMYGPECTSVPEDEYPINFDGSGLSPSGVRKIVKEDGTVYFVMIEEHGPSIIVANSTGSVMKGYAPQGAHPEVLSHGKYPVGEILPGILLESKVQMSFESLSYDMSSETLYVFLEAPLGETYTSSLIRVVSFDASDLMNLEYTGMYAFEMYGASAYHKAGASPKGLAHLVVAAADLVGEKMFVTIETSVRTQSRTTDFIRLDLSKATNLMGIYDSDLELEQISAANNAILMDNEDNNDDTVTKYGDLNPPVELGKTYLMFDADSLSWGMYNLSNEYITSVRMISSSVLAVGTSNSWGFTSSSLLPKLYFIRLSASNSFGGSAPVAGPAGNSLILADTSSERQASQKHLYAKIMQGEKFDMGQETTVETWLKWGGGAQNETFQPLVSRSGNSSIEQAHFLIGVDTESTGISQGIVRAYVGCSYAIGYTLEASSNIINVDEWVHVALVIDGTTSASLYLNGAVAATSSWSPECVNHTVPSMSSADIMIGSFGTGNGINGVVDELRIWSWARSAEMIMTYMNIDISPSMVDGLLGYYQFNDVPAPYGQYEYNFQYFTSTAYEGPVGLIFPDRSDKSRFTPNTMLDLMSMVSIKATDPETSTPFSNMIKLHASDLDCDELSFSIVEVSPELMEYEEMMGESLYFTDMGVVLNFSSLPISLSSDMLYVFASCNSSLEEPCSSLPENIWIRYIASDGSSESMTPATISLMVELCSNLDECGVCEGDGSQCQCGCYHGFTSHFMDYTMFSFLLDENIQKIYRTLQLLTEVEQRVNHRYVGGTQDADYTKYLVAQKKFTTDCLDPFCDAFNPWEMTFEENTPEYLAASSDFDTCECDQSGPETETLPQVYALF